MYICLLKTHTSISRSFTLDKNQSRYSSLGRRGRLRPRAAVSSTSGDRGGLRERPHLPKAVSDFGLVQSADTFFGDKGGTLALPRGVTCSQVSLCH